MSLQGTGSRASSSMATRERSRWERSMAARILARPMADDEKPKRSWREIDKMRDGGRHRSSSDRERERVQNSSQYTRYKQGLDRLFKGGELPPELRAKLDPSGEGAERDEALRKIRLTEDSKSFAAAVDEYLTKFT